MRNWDHPEYVNWVAMCQRCRNPNAHGWKNYGGRGITVFPEWTGRGGFVRFFAYIGPKPTPRHEIDRWPNPDGNYGPGNVRWVTRRENLLGRRRWGDRPPWRKMAGVEFQGRTQTLKQWAAELGMSYHLLRFRIVDWGWSVERALTEPRHDPKAPRGPCRPPSAPERDVWDVD